MTYTVEIVEDSIGTQPGCKQLTTLKLYYPRQFVHQQMLTHRALSRNSSSSRATPISTVIERIRKDPAQPLRWGMNGKGMSDHGEMNAMDAALHLREWIGARDDVIKRVMKMQKHTVVPHKQIVNRLLEPWDHISVTVTATDWDNFLALRCDDAQPEMMHLANLMRETLEDAPPPRRLNEGEWHLPFIQDYEREIAYRISDPAERALAVLKLCQISAARCARVSYVGHDGKKKTYEEDMATYETLINGGKVHASPMEHQAKPDKFTVTYDPLTNELNRVYENSKLHGNLSGWVQFRKTIPGNTTTKYLRRRNK